MQFGPATPVAALIESPPLPQLEASGQQQLINGIYGLSPYSSKLISPLEQPIITLNSTTAAAAFLVHSSPLRHKLITTTTSTVATSTIVSPSSLATAATSGDLRPPISTGELILVGLLISLIIVSIVGNCLVCVAIFTDRRLRKLGNAFIVSLAIADLFVSCLVMTFALCNDLMNYWIFGDWFCDVWISFDIMCSTASILNLCAISLDRFIHIKDCLLYNQWMTRRVAISAVIIIWFISALVSFVPITLGWHKPDHHFGAGNQQMGGGGGFSFSRGGGGVGSGTGSFRNSGADFIGGGGGKEFAWPPGANMATSPHGDNVALAASNSHNNKLDYFGGGGQYGGAFEASKAIENQSSMPQQNQAVDLDAADYGKLSWVTSSSAPSTADGMREEREEKEEEADGDGEGEEKEKEEEDFVSPGATGSSSGGGGEMDGGRTQAQPAVAQFNQVKESNSQDGSQIGDGLKPAARGHHPRGGGGAGTGTGTAGDPIQGGGSDGNGNRQPSLPMDTDAQQLAYRQHPSIGGPQHDEHERQPNASRAGARSHGAEQTPSTSSSSNQAQCMLTLTPTYAIISSTISFYIPCIIMLGLYTKLFACARRHVRNIQAISKAPAPIAISRSIGDQVVGCGGGGGTGGQETGCQMATFTNQHQHQQPPKPPLPLKTWLKFGPKTPGPTNEPNASNAQSNNDKQSINKAINQATTQNKRRGPLRGFSQRCRPASVHKFLGGKLNSTTSQQQPTKVALDVVGEQNEIICHQGDGRKQTGGNDQLPGRIELQQQQQRQGPIDQTTTTIDNPSNGGAGGTPEGNTGRPCEDATVMEAASGPIEQRNQVAYDDSLQIKTHVQMPSNRLETTTRQLQHDNRMVAAAQEEEERRPFLLNHATINHNNGSNNRPPRVAQQASISGHGGLSRSKSCSTKKGSTKVNFQAGGPNQQQSGQLATHKAAVTLGIIMGTFLFCWVPFFCLNIIKAFCVDCIPSSVFRAFTWLGYANSALNPIIYGIHNSEFRNAFNRIFFKHLNIKNSRYYINRRFSYDLRHPATAQTNRQQNCHGGNLNITLNNNNNNNYHHHHVNTSNAHYHRPNPTLKSDHAVT